MLAAYTANNERIGLPHKGNEIPKKCPHLWKGRSKRERLFIPLRFKHSRTLPRHRISGKRGSCSPTRLIHIWKALDREARGVRVYTSPRDTSICFWERRKLAYTENKPKRWIKLNPQRGNRHRLDGPESIFFFFLSFEMCMCVCVGGWVWEGEHCHYPFFSFSSISKISLLKTFDQHTLEMKVWWVLILMSSPACWVTSRKFLNFYGPQGPLMASGGDFAHGGLRGWRAERWNSGPKIFVGGWLSYLNFHHHVPKLSWNSLSPLKRKMQRGSPPHAVCGRGSPWILDKDNVVGVFRTCNWIFCCCLEGTG